GALACAQRAARCFSTSGPRTVHLAHSWSTWPNFCPPGPDTVHVAHFWSTWPIFGPHRRERTGSVRAGRRTERDATGRSSARRTMRATLRLSPGSGCAPQPIEDLLPCLSKASSPCSRAHVTVESAEPDIDRRVRSSLAENWLP